MLWDGGGETRVLVLGHHDTVFPLGTLAARPFAVDDRIVTGPGVFDMLGGIVQGVEGLSRLPVLDHVKVLVTCDEETGSHHSRELIEELATGCRAVLVLEGAGVGGALKTSRKGCGTFGVHVTGRASHAGLEPEAGINALIEAAHQVHEIAALGRPDLGTTVIPTLARAGTLDNVVPAYAEIAVDVRVETNEEKARVEQSFAALAPRLPGAALTVSGGIGRPPMPRSTAIELIALARRLCPGVEDVHVGGGSDGNFTAALGVPTLDGLGAVGGGAHSDDEHLLIDFMVERADLVAGLVRTSTAD